MTDPPCSEFCPFLGCASCESSGGENPPAATVSDAELSPQCATMERTQTSGPGLHTETALVTPIQASEREDLPGMMPQTDHPERASAVDGCPECVANVEPPLTTETTPHGFLAEYVCTDCGHRWSTSWAA